MIQQTIPVRLDNGQMIRIPIQQPEEVHGRPHPDIKNYGHLVLETCVIFAYFTTLIKTPDRARLLGVCKMMMTALKVNNIN